MVYFLTIGGKQAGYGHIARCIALFDAVIELGHKASFVVEGDDSIDNMLSKNAYTCANWLTNDTIKAINIKPGDTIIIDCLVPDQHLIRKLKSITKKVYVIDDAYEALHPGAQIINWRVDAENVPLSGSSYVPLRKEIMAYRQKTINRIVKHVIITLGGSDTKGLTPEIIRLFNHRDLSRIKLEVIIGGAFQNFEQLIALERTGITFHHSPSANNLYRLMSICDIAIAAGGHSIYELAYVGTPTVHLLVVDNQKPAEAWNQTGFTYSAGWHSSNNFFDKISKGIHHFIDPQTRRKASVTGQKLVDGLGAARIARIIAEA